MDQLFALGLVSTGTKILELAPTRYLYDRFASAKHVLGARGVHSENRAMLKHKSCGHCSAPARPVSPPSIAPTGRVSAINARPVTTVRASKYNRCWRASVVTQRSCAPLVSCPDCFASGLSAIKRACDRPHQLTLDLKSRSRLRQPVILLKVLKVDVRVTQAGLKRHQRCCTADHSDSLVGAAFRARG